MHDQLGLFINGTWRTETAERLTSEIEAGGVAINTAAPMYADAPSAASRTAASVTRAA